MLANKDDILRELARVREEDQQTQLATLGGEGLAWLALVPAWTEELAQSCSFPAGTQGLMQFLKSAEARGLCQRRVDDEYGREFWIRRGEYQPTIELLKTEFGLDFLRNEASKAGDRVRNALASTKVSPKVQRWSQLAVQMESLAKAGAWLEDFVADLIARDKSGEATAWLDTAAPLAALFGDKLEEAFRLGYRRLELAHRRRQDERHLLNFLERDAQIEALDRVIAGDDGTWALHFLGVGGVGKTMLVRFLNARLARDGVPAARLDFDYIGADYPARRPGQLLVELMTELLTHGVEQPLLVSFRNAVDSLHDAMSHDDSVTRDPVAALSRHQRRYDRMINAFCSLLMAVFRPGKPVMLILDTCEELAKFQPPGSRLPSVEVMFKILEDMHDDCRKRGPGELPFRVVFAGRRPLAQGGRHWSLKPTDIGNRHLLPEPKVYLALHELRGFDHREAKLYLCKKREVQIPTRAVYKAILAHSLEARRPADLRQVTSDYPRRRFRYNPFDLSLYAEWLKAEPTLSAEQIASGAADPYLEYRILERLRQRELEYLLPALVLLGRFDRPVLDALIRTRPEADLDTIARELGDQEWIDSQHDELLKTTFLQIDINLLPRLRAYYAPDRTHAGAEGRAAALGAAKRVLGPILEARIRQSPGGLRRVPANYIDAALRVLPAGAAARLWNDIEERIPTEADWSWPTRILGWIMSEGGAVEALPHPLWPALAATLASVQLHTERDANVRTHWTAVSESAPRHPVPEIRRTLGHRAFFGLLATWPRTEWPIAPAADMRRLLQPALSDLDLAGEDASRKDAASTGARHQLAAAVCAAMGNVLDVAEANAASIAEPEILHEWVDRIDRLHFPREVVGFGRMLAGRALLLNGEERRARDLLRRTVSMPAAESGDAKSPAERWFDWIPPRDLESRLRLEAVRAFPAVLDPVLQDELGTWRNTAVSRGAFDDIDRDRLVAACLEKGLAMRVPDVERLEEIRRVLRYHAGLTPTCLAHLRTPHLFAVLAQSYVALGLTAPALALLNEFKAAATASGKDDPAVRAAQGGLLETVRRARLRAELSLLNEWKDSPDVEKAVVAWPAAVLTGDAHGGNLPMTAATATPATLRIWRACQSTTVILPELEGRVREWVGDRSWSELEYDVAALVLELDQASGLPKPEDGEGWWRQHRDRPEEALRLALVQEALRPGRAGVPDALLACVPPRRRAEIAFEEGELLALRRPGTATRIMQRAVDGFRAASDPVGELRAAICAATILVRSSFDEAKDAPKKVGAYLDTVVAPQYESLVARSRPGWPRWSEFRKEGDRSPDRRMLEDPEWGEWLARLAACCDYAAAHPEKSRDALRAHYRDRPPVELAGWNAGALARARIVNWSDPPRRVFRPGTLARLGVAALQFLLGAAFIVGINYLMYRGFNWALGLVGVPPDVSTAPRVLAYLAALVAAGLGIRVWRSLVEVIARPVRSRLATRTVAGLTISESEGEAVKLRLDLIEKRVSWKPPFVRSEHGPRENDTTVQSTERYSVQTLGPSIAVTMADLRRRLAGRSVDVMLEASRRSLHEPAWEALLAHAAVASGGEPISTLRALRPWRAVISNAPRSPFRNAGWELGLVRAVCSQSAAHAVEKGWRDAGVTVVNLPSPRLAGPLPEILGKLDLTGPPRLVALELLEHLLSRLGPSAMSDYVVRFGIGARAGETPSGLAHRIAHHVQSSGRGAELLARVQRLIPDQALPYRVLHLVGTPVETASDLHWQIANVGQTEAVYSKSAYGGAAGYAGDLLAADDVPFLFTPLILLQCEPTPSVRGRSAFDREQSAQVRSFACKLVTAGAEAALTLPSLESSWVPETIQRIATALKGANAPDLPRLLAVAEAARSAIADRTRTASFDDAGEIALDVCLMVRSTAPRPSTMQVGASGVDDAANREARS